MRLQEERNWCPLDITHTVGSCTEASTKLTVCLCRVQGKRLKGPVDTDTTGIKSILLLFCVETVFKKEKTGKDSAILKRDNQSKPTDPLISGC